MQIETDTITDRRTNGQTNHLAVYLLSKVTEITVLAEIPSRTTVHM